MPATRRNVNWYGVGFTPVGGSLIPITGVTGIDYDPNGNLLKFSGDMDRFNSTVIADFSDPTVTITTADTAAIRSLPFGTRGVLVFTHKDAKNQAATSGPGDITYTFSGAIVMNNPISGQHRQYGTGRLVICAESTDGLTNPMASAVA